MTIFENKKLERDTFRKLRDGISLNQRENVEKNVKLYIDSFIKEYKNLSYIAIYWPLKNEIDNNNLIEDKNIFIKEVSKKAYRSRLIVLYIVISSINLPKIGRIIQDQSLN